MGGRGRTEIVEGWPDDLRRAEPDLATLETMAVTGEERLASIEAEVMATADRTT